MCFSSHVVDMATMCASLGSPRLRHNDNLDSTALGILEKLIVSVICVLQIVSERVFKLWLSSVEAEVEQARQEVSQGLESARQLDEYTKLQQKEREQSLEGIRQQFEAYDAQAKEAHRLLEIGRTEHDQQLEIERVQKE